MTMRFVWPDLHQLPEALTIGQCATLACLWDIIATKPGNVHRGADFEDIGFSDFATSAVAIAPAVQAAYDGRLGLGEAVLSAVRQSKTLVGTNAHLGTILLLVPLAQAFRDGDWESGKTRVLAGLSSDDCRLTYEAIRLAEPGGLGAVEQGDVHGPAPTDILEAMRWAAHRDAVARQYATGFADILGPIRSSLQSALDADQPIDTAIVAASVEQMAREGDSLIARKCGAEINTRAQQYAGAVMAAGSVGSDAWWDAAGELDFWLRSDGHRRNPGTTADLVTAAVFVLLAEQSRRTEGPN